MSDDIKKIECEEAIRMMLEYLDSELHHHDHDSMDEHLESCRSHHRYRRPNQYF